MNFKPLTLAMMAILGASAAQATASIDLSRYSLTGNHTLEPLGGLGLEASAVSYAADRDSLFFVGDEGMGVVEVDLVGNTLGTMAFDWTGTGSSHNDAEGLTYLGNGRLVVVDERPQMAYQFGYANGATVRLNTSPQVAITGNSTSVGNVGTEGISVDPATGKYFSVKQDGPVQLRQHVLDFGVGGGTASSTVLYSHQTSLFGLSNLSDVQTLSAVSALAGTAAADNLLLLSADSGKLVELDMASGHVLSSFDLTGITPQAIEGVTVDTLGNIYLVAEDSGTGHSRLLVLSAPVPEPGTWALMASGLSLLGFMGGRRRRA